MDDSIVPLVVESGTGLPHCSKTLRNDFALRLSRQRPGVRQSSAALIRPNYFFSLTAAPVSAASSAFHTSAKCLAWVMCAAALVPP